jgi:DNA-directed RNA polymerase subunit RPC12/RpoP
VVLRAAGGTIGAVTVLVCARCGRSLDSEADEQSGLTALAWVHSHERGRDLFYCPACSRENLRSIEGKLDAEFW